MIRHHLLNPPLLSHFLSSHFSLKHSTIRQKVSIITLIFFFWSREFLPLGASFVSSITSLLFGDDSSTSSEVRRHKPEDRYKIWLEVEEMYQYLFKYSQLTWYNLCRVDPVISISNVIQTISQFIDDTFFRACMFDIIICEFHHNFI